MNQKFKIKLFIKSYGKMGLFTLSMIVGCGEATKPQSPMHDSSITATQSTPQTSNADPSQMTAAELKLFLADLKKRDSVEQDEYYFLNAVNKDLCDRVQRLRSECVAIVPLFGTQKILGCDGTYEENTSVSHKFSVGLDANQTFSYKIIADNNIESTTFSGGQTEIKFEKVGNEKIDAPTWEEVTSLKLVSVGTILPDLSELGFKLTIDETLVFTGDQLIAEGTETDKFYRINPSKLIKIAESSSCRMTPEELEQIEQSVKDRAKN